MCDSILLFYMLSLTGSQGRVPYPSLRQGGPQASTCPRNDRPFGPK